MRYAVDLIADEDTVRIECPDIPGVHTFGDDAEDALSHASDAIESMMMILMDRRLPIPVPRARRQYYATIPPLSAAKIELYRAMLAQKLRKADLVRMLGWKPVQVDRLLNLNHASRLDQLELAAGVLGKRLEIEVKDAA